MIYLDNSATTKPHEDVLKTFIVVNERYYANPASIHEMGVESNDLLDQSRKQIARMLATDDKNIIFTSGGTESNNLAIFGLAYANQHKGKHIITTEIEHPSILEAVKKLEMEGFEVDYLKSNTSGVISLQQLQQLLRRDTILVSMMHVNNEIGSIQPIHEAATFIHANSRAIFHVDAVQSFGKLAIAFEGDNGPDCMTISAHKIHGLKGTGLLAMRKSFMIEPQLLGGKQEFGVRSGTVAVPQIVTLAKAMRLASETQQSQLKKYEQWNRQLRHILAQFDKSIAILSPQSGAPHILAFSVKGLKGEVVVNALQKRGVIVSTSSACSSKQTKVSHVIEAIAVTDDFKKGMIRISFGSHVTNEEIEQTQKIVHEVLVELKGEK